MEDLFSVAQLMSSQVAGWDSIGNKRKLVAGFEPAFPSMGGSHANLWASFVGFTIILFNGELGSVACLVILATERQEFVDG